MSKLRIAYEGAGVYRVAHRGPKSVRIYKPQSLPLGVLVERIGAVVTEWDAIGKVLSFFTAGTWEEEDAAEALGIEFIKE